MTVHVRGLLPGVHLAERPLPGYGGEVRATYIEGTRHRVLVDTLLSPKDVSAFSDATLVVNSHADWDHVWGNPAFVGQVPIMGHRLCRERLLRDDGRKLREAQSRDPGTYAGAGIVPPDLVFDGVQVIDAGGLTLELHPLPGHTDDSVVCYLPERKLLLAADSVELPIPSLEMPGAAREYARRLREWADRGIEVVIPGHGPVGGSELLLHNAAYIELLFQRVNGLVSRLTDEEIQRLLPLEEFVREANRYDLYYQDAHKHNIQVVMVELTGAR